jgi:hypothetical protein
MSDGQRDLACRPPLLLLDTGCCPVCLSVHLSCLSVCLPFNEVRHARQVPLMILGGGGYTMRNVARCWCYETGKMLGLDLPDECALSMLYLSHERVGTSWRLGPALRVLPYVCSSLNEHYPSCRFLWHEMLHGLGLVWCAFDKVAISSTTFFKRPFVLRSVHLRWKQPC